MKNNVISAIALLLAIVALLLSAFAVYQIRLQPDPTRKLAALEEENKNLQEQLDTLAAQLTQQPAEIGLADWALIPEVLTESNSARITFTAAPIELLEGMEARLVVHLNGKAAADVTCTLTEGSYCATVELPAANGYAYYCMLTDADGNTEQIPLITPEYPDELLINLADSLNVYCTLFAEDFRYHEDALTVIGCQLALQLPRLSSDTGLDYERSQLVLVRNDNAESSQTVVLEPAGTPGSLIQTLDEVTFTVPELEDGDLLELWLEAVLSDGTVITVSGASWFCEDGELIYAVG